MKIIYTFGSKLKLHQKVLDVRRAALDYAQDMAITSKLGKHSGGALVYEKSRRVQDVVDELIATREKYGFQPVHKRLVLELA